MPSNFIFKKFDEAKSLIQEADIILFRGQGFISRLISIAGRGPYTHVGMASWKYRKNGHDALVPDILELVEFREFKGGRTVSLESQVKDWSGRVDVYRISQQAQIFDVDHPDGLFKTIDQVAITNTMREMTGLPYGWARILAIGKTHILGLRTVYSPNIDDNYIAETYPVCSTVVARSVRRHYVDLMHNLSDDHTEPNHIANSALTHYLFTLTH